MKQKKICPEMKSSATDAKPVKMECGRFTAIGSIVQEKCVPKSLCF